MTVLPVAIVAAAARRPNGAGGDVQQADRCLPRRLEPRVGRAGACPQRHRAQRQPGVQDLGRPAAGG